MRAWYVHRRNEPILDMRMIVSFACALLLVLAWLLPREEFFRQMLTRGDADHVSVAYARLLVALHPDDLSLKMLLAEQYYRVGALREAWEVIDSPEFPPSVLRATLILELGYASAPGPERRHWEDMLEGDLRAAVADPSLSEEMLATFARAAFAVGQPRLAARFFERRYRAHGDPGDLVQAVSAWRAADEVASAAAVFSHAGADLNPDQLRLGLEVYLAAGGYDDAFALMDRWLAGNEADPALAAELVRFAQLAGDAQRTRRYLAMVGEGGSLDDRTLLALAGFAIASGELGRGAGFLEQLLAREPEDAGIREQLARVYRWNGDPEKALAHWLELVDATGDELFLAEARELAHGLYHYGVSANLLTRLAGIRRLTDQEVVSLREAFELQGLPDAGIAVLKDYLARQPGHRRAWLELIALQQDNHYLVAATATWRAFAAVHPLDVQEHIRWADLLWERYRTKEAVDVMLWAGNPESPEFWRRLTAYAWFLDDMDLTTRAYDALAGLADLDHQEYQRYLFALAVTHPDRVGDRALEAWQTYQDPEFFLMAMRFAVENGDKDLAARLLPMSESYRDRLSGEADFWQLLAYYQQEMGDLDAASRSLAEGLSHHPDSAALLSAYLWTLIQMEDAPRLESALARHEALAAQRSELWQVFASGYATLGRHREAAGWFARAVSADASDLPLLLAYAGSLEAMGMNDPAFRLRRHVIGEIAASRQTTATTLDTLAGASRGVLTVAQQRALMAWLEERGALSFDARHLPPFYLSQALAQNHYTAARYWLTRGEEEADVWQRLAVASERQDHDALSRLLDHPRREVRIQAALALDRPALAWRQAGPDGRDGLARMALAGSYYSRYPTGWQVGPEYTRLSGLDVETVRLHGAGRVRELRVDSTLSFHQLSDALRLRPGRVDEAFWRVRAGGRNPLGDAVASVSLLSRAGELLPGFTVSQEFRPDRRNRIRVGGAYQQLTEITALARAAAQRSGLNLGWQNSLGRNDVLNVNATLDFYRSPSGTELGRGGQLEVRYDHSLLLAAPQLSLGGSLYMTRNSDFSREGSLLDDRLVPRDESLLPDATNRLSLHAVINRGDPGDLGWEYSSPRYRLGAAVGYQWPENAPTLEFEASIGMSLLGRDELSFRTAYSSSLLSAVGGDGYRASLVYSRRFGY